MVFSGGLAGVDEGPSLRRRILYTLLLLLAFRLLTQIPAANVDEERLHQLLASNPLLGMVDIFAGGEVLTHFSLVAAGIVPYMAAFFLVEFASLSIPALRRLWGIEDLSGSGLEKRKKRMEVGVKVASVPLAFLFAWLLSQYLGVNNQGAQSEVFPHPMHWFSRASFRSSLGTICLVTAGSLISTWIADVISKKGVGEGKDQILLVGSSLTFAKQIAQTAGHSHGITAIWRVGLTLLCGVAVVVLSVYVLETTRWVPVNYAKRIVSSGRLLAAQQSKGLPLRPCGGYLVTVTGAIGVMAVPEFLRALLAAHSGTAAWAAGRVLTAWTSQKAGWYWLTLACLMVFFTYFYNIGIVQGWTSPEGVPITEKLKKAGAFVPGFAPGRRTQEYLLRTTRAFSLPGGLALAFLMTGVPYAILRLTGINTLVTLLSIIVVVGTVENLRGALEIYKYPGKYAGLIRRAQYRT